MLIWSFIRFVLVDIIAQVCVHFTFRTSLSRGRLESGENPGHLLGSAQILRGQPDKTAFTVNLRQIVVRPHGPADAWQPKFRDVLLAQIAKQEITTFPGRDLGREYVTRVSRIFYSIYLFLVVVFTVYALHAMFLVQVYSLSLVRPMTLSVMPIEFLQGSKTGTCCKRSVLLL